MFKYLCFFFLISNNLYSQLIPPFNNVIFNNFTAQKKEDPYNYFAIGNTVRSGNAYTKVNILTSNPTETILEFQSSFFTANNDTYKIKYASLIDEYKSNQTYEVVANNVLENGINKKDYVFFLSYFDNELLSISLVSKDQNLNSIIPEISDFYIIFYNKRDNE